MKTTRSQHTTEVNWVMESQMRPTVTRRIGVLPFLAAIHPKVNQGETP
jgi:hypothetical protein